MRSAVVLPEPDGPTMTRNSPSAIVQVERVDGRLRRCRRRSASPARSARPPSAHLQLGLEALDRRAELVRSRCCASASAPTASSPSSAAPTIGGWLVRRRTMRGADLAQPVARSGRAAVARADASARRRPRPPPASSLSPSRTNAARASATISSASRSPISSGDRDRPSASTTGASSMQPAPRQLADVHRVRNCRRSVVAEVRGHELLELRLRPAPVLAARRGQEPGQADVVAAAPVAGDLAERREPHVAAVGRRRRRS